MGVIKGLKKAGNALFSIYFGIGVCAMGLLAVIVIFTVIARYCFSLNWKELAEFNVTLFAFTTFWSMGLCLLKDEHVMIDILYDRIKPSVKRWLSVVNYVIVLAVVIIFTVLSYKYTMMAGKQNSMGMEVPMFYMYGIMPVSGVICCLCAAIKIVESIVADVSKFEPKNVVVESGGNKERE